MSARFRKLRMEQMEARQMMAVTGLIGNLTDKMASVSSGPDLVTTSSGTDVVVTDGMAPGEDDGGGVAASIPITNELPLNSLPGAPASLYLDFNGHFQAEGMFDTLGFGGRSNILTPAFDRDNDPTTFNYSEQDEIRHIWAMVAEDYAPFNLNVTTVEPDASRPFLRVVISGGSDFMADSPADEAWGITEKDWTGNYNSYADPGDPNVVYVFTRANNFPAVTNTIATSASHEAGHAFGLSHYSHSTGDLASAPIMRDGLNPNDPFPQRMVWWSNGSQTDMAVIASSDNGFGYRPDDHGDFVSGPSSMIQASHALAAHGIIGAGGDTDVFRFDVGGGQVNIDLTVPGNYIANLNADLLLYDSKGALIAFDSPPDKLGARLVKDLPAGTYYAAVQGDSAYGDVGQYSLFVTESGPQVVSSKFQSLGKNQFSLTVTFNEAINTSTFTTADVRINGGAAGAGVLSVTRSKTDSKTFLVKVNLPSSSVRSGVSIGPNIEDLSGNGMDQNKNGINAEAVDAYMAEYISVKGGSVLNTTTTTTKTTTTKKRR
jgi:hypothetical protein